MFTFKPSRSREQQHIALAALFGVLATVADRLRMAIAIDRPDGLADDVLRFMVRPERTDATQPAITQYDGWMLWGALRAALDPAWDLTLADGQISLVYTAPFSQHDLTLAHTGVDGVVRRDTH